MKPYKVNMVADFGGQTPMAVSARNLAWELHTAGVDVCLVPLHRGKFVQIHKNDFSPYPYLYDCLLKRTFQAGAPAIYHGLLREILRVPDENIPPSGAVASIPFQLLPPPSEYAITSLASRYKQVWVSTVDVLVAINRKYPGLAIFVPWVFPSDVYEPRWDEIVHSGYEIMWQRDADSSDKEQQETPESSRRILFSAGEKTTAIPTDIAVYGIPTLAERVKLYRNSVLVCTSADDLYWECEGRPWLHSYVRATDDVSHIRSSGGFGAALEQELIHIADRTNAVTVETTSVYLKIVIPFYQRNITHFAWCLYEVLKQVNDLPSTVVHYPTIVYVEKLTDVEEKRLESFDYEKVSIEQWNLSLARNAGARMSSVVLKDPTHFMFLDCDVVLQPGTLCGIIRKISTDPNTVHVFNVINLDQEGRRTYTRIGSGCCVVPCRPFYDVRGYDESFDGWGSEDVDLLTRLEYIGVRSAIAHDLPPLTHLWHEHDKNQGEERERNAAKLRSADPSRVVNPDGWGGIPGRKKEMK